MSVTNAILTLQNKIYTLQSLISALTSNTKYRGEEVVIYQIFLLAHKEVEFYPSISVDRQPFK